METPQLIFVAGLDAIETVGGAVQARLKAVYALQELSQSTDGSF